MSTSGSLVAVSTNMTVLILEAAAGNPIRELTFESSRGSPGSVSLYL